MSQNPNIKLVIDEGNSRTKAAVFSGDELMAFYHWTKDPLSHLDSILNEWDIQSCILSSVASDKPDLDRQLSGLKQFIRLDHHTPLPIINTYKSPETLGRDRIAAVVAAFYLFPKSPCLVIDAGTCITYDLINVRGEYLGGGISPGIGLRFKAMHDYTAKLPFLERQRLENDIGYTTESSMRVGAQIGAVLEVEGFIERYTAQFNELKVLITGGDGDYFVSQLKSEIFAHPNLVLYGLNKILDYNAS